MNIHQVVIVGGGAAGITVAARLKRLVSQLDIAIIEPSKNHYYQPIWTLVGAGVFDKSISRHAEAELIPKGVKWYQEAADQFQPENNLVITKDGTEIYYKYLVVCPGIQYDWNKIEGLEGNVGKYGICCNYSYDHVEYTWETIRNFKGGRAIFTHPNSPIKCGGAPQKIMYLAEEAFHSQGVRDKTEIVFQSANPTIFPVEKYAKTLNKLVKERDIHVNYRKNLVKIDGPNKKATFQDLDTKEEETLDYEMIHAVPYMSAPDFIKKSPLADAAGWVDVDAYTLQHNRYENVFSLGDASSLPTSKTGAAVRKQAPVVVSNLYALLKDKKPWRKYEGYTSCPIATGYHSLIMVEFKYGNVPDETFPFDQSKERLSMFLMKKYGLPAIYWHGMMKGRM